MTVIKDQGRQYPLVAVFDLVPGDMLLDGTAEEVIDFPGDAWVTGGEIVVDTAFDAATSSVCDIGDGDDDDRYGAAVDLAATGRTALTLDGHKYSAPDTIDLKVTEVGGPSVAGAARLLVYYVIDDKRAHENQDLKVADYGSHNLPT